MAANMQKRRPSVIDPRAAERRRSLMIKVGATAIVVVIAVAVGVWLIVTKEDSSTSSSSGSSAAAGSAPGKAPSVVTATGAYRVSGPGGTPKVTLSLVEDFQCPACRQFESIFGDALKQIRAENKVAVDYKPIAFLDRMSSTQYSTRSANASACVAEATAATGNWSTWLKYHDALYAQQPEEQSSGLTDGTLTSIATSVGVSQSVSTCISTGTYASWVGTQTAAVEKDDFQGTPQVELKGTLVELSTPAALISAVNTALAQ